jgi:hypothetical protein
MPDIMAGAALTTQAAALPSALTQWGNGELVSVLFGLAFMAFGCGRHRKGLNQEKAIGFLSNGIAFGPLIMIVLDPINKQFSLLPIDLFQVAMLEARVTLWWGSALASLNILVGLFKANNGILHAEN